MVNNWTSNVLPGLLANYSEENIFNADETGLFYHLQPNRTLHFRGEKCTGGKQSKERLSVLVGANMAGTEKLKLLVIGKSAKPRCFKNVKTLPVTYRNNKKAWMTSEIFLDWLKSLDSRFRRERRNCLLLIDNCPSHPNPIPLPLTNLTVHFLPKNTTSHTQPCDAGVIRDLKHRYRTRLVKKMLAHIEASDAQSTFKPTVLDAIRMISAAWQEVKPTTLKNCFRKAGWKKEGGMESEADEEEEEEDLIPLSVLRERLLLPESMTFDDYVSVDDNLLTFEQMTETDLLMEIAASNRDEEEEEEEQDDDGGDGQQDNGNSQICSQSEARTFIEELRKYFESKAQTSDITFSSINQLESAVTKCVNLRQPIINDFFLHL